MAEQKQELENPGQKTPPTPGQAAVEPSGYKGDNPSTAGQGQTGVRSGTPENKAGHINPSAPEDSNITPGSDSLDK